MAFDPSDSYANNLKGMGRLKIYNPSIEKSNRPEVWFKAWLVSLKDSYEVSRSEELIFGRNDPHIVTAGTQRRLTAAFTIPAFDAAEAALNLSMLQELIKYLYPLYRSTTGSSVKSKAYTRVHQSITRIKFGNLISGKDSPSTSAKEGGINVYLDGISFTPNVEAGFIIGPGGENSTEIMLPKELTLDLTGRVIHDHLSGWDVNNPKEAEFFRKSFPYGVSSKWHNDPAGMVKSIRGKTTPPGPPATTTPAEKEAGKTNPPKPAKGSPKAKMTQAQFDAMVKRLRESKPAPLSDAERDEMRRRGVL